MSFTGFEVRIERDDSNAVYHGYVGVKIKGVWGSVCNAGWDDTAADIVCKDLGYNSGVAYAPASKNKSPILMSNVVCSQQEDDLIDCANEYGSIGTNCSFNAVRAGVLCSKTSGRLTILQLAIDIN